MARFQELDSWQDDFETSWSQPLPDPATRGQGKLPQRGRGAPRVEIHVPRLTLHPQRSTSPAVQRQDGPGPTRSQERDPWRRNDTEIFWERRIPQPIAEREEARREILTFICLIVIWTLCAITTIGVLLYATLGRPQMIKVNVTEATPGTEHDQQELPIAMALTKSRASLEAIKRIVSTTPNITNSSVTNYT